MLTKKRIILTVVFLIFAALSSLYLISLKSTKIFQISNREINNLHWLDNNDLAYTYFDPQIRQKALAHIKDGQEEVLIKNPQTSMDELFWSKNSNLFIYQYGTPNKAYVWAPDNKLTTKDIQGFGFSWSPDGQEIFYNDATDSLKTIPTFFDLNSSIKSAADFQLPDFSASFWSPNKNQIILYEESEDAIGDTSPKTILVNLSSKTQNQVMNDNQFYPLWSPSGDKIVYLSKEGVKVYEPNGKSTLVYPANSWVYLTFTWLNNKDLIVADGNSEITKLIRIDTSNNTISQLLKELKLPARQKIEIAVSPNNKTLAIASQNNGFYLVYNF